MTDIKENSLQIRFLERIKDMIPASNSLVNELAEVLNVSTDSAYRRIRGETALTIDEISLLCNHFKIGFDIFSEQTGSVSFDFDKLNGIEGFRKYLIGIRNTLVALARTENAELYYAALDVPIVHHFNYPDLSAFKIFYWLKDVINEPSLEGMKYDPSIIDNDLLELGKEIYQAYCKISSIEVWTSATLNSSIAQIEYYSDSGLFENQSVALAICNQLEEEVRTIQKQAERSGKAISDNSLDNFKLYVSEIEIGNNCILTSVADVHTVIMSFHTFNKLTTVNTVFCNDTFKWLSNLIRKSTLISGVSEKQRYLFFKQIYDKIAKLKQRLDTTTEN
jgi:hypothetical protein